ncbi:uncharacterized protein LOC143046522 [Mytilus galloprovincialis]|uniref:uncharacterized protein LOC143046522 n=1 Tax=Mytilus galloprovincialis TaxID=29158 RepID=UPI003F7CCA6B
MKCVQPHSGNQRTERSGQTEEETIQEANHSDDSLPVTQGEDEHEEQPTEVEQLDEAEEIERIEPTVHREDGIETTVRREDRIEPTTQREENEPCKENIKWPTNADKAAWKALDEDLENILEATLAGRVDRKITAMTSIIYSVGKDRFGVIPQGKQSTKQGHSNRRQKKIKELRGDLRRLKKRYKVAKENERLPLQQLRKETREKLKTLTRAETHRRDRKKKAKERATFTANPFQYMKRLFGARGSGKLENSREEVEEHLSKTHSDERRGEDLEECEKLLTPEEPKEQFDESRSAGRSEKVEKPSRGPLLSSGVRQPPVRAFMDDMTVTAKTVIEGRWTLEELERMIKWARMKFKPSKSRSLIVRKGKVQDETFELAGEKIPTVGEKPVKCLGKKFDATLADMVNMGEVQVQLVEWLTKIDKSGLPGRYKAYKTGYDVERQQDAKVRGAKVKIRTGRKWKAEEAVKEAETRLKHSVIVGVTAVGRQGFGMTTKPRWDTSNEKERRELVQQEIRQMEEESRNVKAVGMKQQGSWLNWQGARSRALTWSEIWSMEGYRLSFLLRSVAGEKKDNQAEGLGILGTASDWQMTANIHQRMSFPAEIAATSLRPDIVIWSQGTRQAVLLELTVPWEDRIEEAYERKMAKYQQLVEDCKQRGWRTWCMAIEVGCRGFAGQSMWRALRTLGVVGAERKKLITEVCRVAEVASQWIWRKRDEVWKSAK